MLKNLAILLILFVMTLGSAEVRAQNKDNYSIEGPKTGVLTTTAITDAFKSIIGTSIADALQAMLSQPTVTIDGFVINAQELKRFYAQRNYRPVWDTKPDGDRASLKNFLSTVTAFTNYHGLVEERYPVAQLTKLIESKQEEDSKKIEVLVTAWLFQLGHDLHGDTLKLSHIYPGWEFRRDPVDMVTGFEKAIQDNKVYDYVASFAPDYPAYLRLARELKAYRDMRAKGPWPTVATGPTIKPGEQSQRVAQVRARLAAEGYQVPEDDAHRNIALYDQELKSFVEQYQSRNGLQADGNIGAKTIAAMNVSLNSRIDQIIANMERWRHMPDNLPPRYVMVNIAATTLEVVDEGKSIYEGPVVAGRPDRKTPFIQSEIRSVIFNPAWHVPAKIARKDILPKLRKDPYYLEKMGFVIKGSADDPHGAEIDWNAIHESEFNFRLRQSPGDINSLGRLKFDFDNDFAVYMHGTPHPELFAKAERHLSSGCVRLHDPDKFAEIVLSQNETEWTLDRVKAEVDKGKTRWLKVAEPLPVFFVYWTVFPGENDGPLNFRKDVYAYDSFLIEVMRKDATKESAFAVKNKISPLI